MISDFEAYLLSKMRGKSLVMAVLLREGISQHDLTRKAEMAARLWELDRPGYSASIYAEAIGKPVFEKTLTGSEMDPIFVGSIHREYQLELWPKVLFCVNQHPAGYAWGEGFVQERIYGNLLDPKTIKPWEWTAWRIEESAFRTEVIDHWNREKDLRVTFIEKSGEVNYLAKFDYNLLQEWMTQNKLKERIS